MYVLLNGFMFFSNHFPLAGWERPTSDITPSPTHADHYVAYVFSDSGVLLPRLLEKIGLSTLAASLLLDRAV